MQKYSFLMSVYNKDNPKYLCESIESMLAQTAFPDEIIVVKDGSLTNELNLILDNYKSKWNNLFTIVSLEKNKGLGLALNAGIEISRNELIARMDSDDISEKDRCRLQLMEFERDPTLDIVGTSTCAFMGDPNNVISINHVPCSFDEIYQRGKRHAPFSHVTVMYRKSTLQKFGCYGSYRRAQDADLFGRMLFEGCNAKNIDSVLVKVRKDDLAVRKKSKTNIQSILEIKKNQRKMGYISFADYMYLWIKYRASLLVPNFVYQKIYLMKFGEKNN